MSGCGSYNANIQYINDGEEVDAAVANRPISQLASNQQYMMCLIQAISASGGPGTGSLVSYSVLMKSTVQVGTPVFFNTMTSQYEPAFDDGTVKRYVVGLCINKTTSTIGDLLVAGTVPVSLAIPTGTMTPSPGRYFLSTITVGGLSTTIAGVQVCFLDTSGNVTFDSRIQDPINEVFPIPLASTSNSFGSPILTITNPTGYLMGVGTLFNLGANDMVIQETATDYFGNTDSEQVTIEGGFTPVLFHRLKLWRGFATAQPPLVTYSLFVQSAVADTPTTYKGALLVNRF
jgi:hypothetical protein